MMALLVQSLYGTYTQVVDGKIEVAQKFLDRDGPRFSLAFSKNIETTYVTINEIFKKKIRDLYGR